MKPAEALIPRIVAVANASDHSKAGPHAELYSAVDELCGLGPSARVDGLRSVHGIEDMMARMGVAATLIAAEPGLRDGIYAEALDALSGSTCQEDVVLLSELVHLFDGNVPRRVLKAALVRAWKGSTGVLRENLAYDLRRRGHKQAFGFWL